MAPERPPIKLFQYAQAIEYNAARILLSAHYQLYRNDDSKLWLLKKEEDNQPWRKPHDSEEPILHRLYVANGFFTDTVYYPTSTGAAYHPPLLRLRVDNKFFTDTVAYPTSMDPIKRFSHPAQDLIYYHDFMIPLAKAVEPEFKLKEPNYIGHTRTVNDYVEQCVEVLSSHPTLYTIL
jgi:hypothetical protein